MSHRVLFSGYYGFDNSGDDAILFSIIQELKRRDSSIDITVLSYNPKNTRELYRVKSVQRFHYPSVKEAMDNTDLLISGGGSLLQDVTSSRSLYYYLGIIRLAKKYKKKTFVYANGVGPIRKKINQIFTARTLNLIDGITLRDEDSLQVIKDIGVTKPPVEVTADPVYQLRGASASEAKNFLLKEGISPEKSYIGVSIREWGEVPNLHEKMARVLDQVYTKVHKEILFIPLHYPGDRDFNEKIRQKMVYRNKAHVLQEKYMATEIQGMIGLTDVMLSMRLHGLIFSVTENVPSVGLVYDPKVKSHLEQLENPFYVEVNDFSEEKLVEMIVDVNRNRFHHKRELALKQRELLERSRRNVDYVFQLLEQ